MDDADVGRPRRKGKDVIRISDTTSVLPIVAFLRRALRIHIDVPQFSFGEFGITDMGKNIDQLLAGLKARTIGAIYLPNLRWFPGEEVRGTPTKKKREGRGTPSRKKARSKPREERRTSGVFEGFHRSIHER